MGRPQPSKTTGWTEYQLSNQPRLQKYRRREETGFSPTEENQKYLVCCYGFVKSIIPRWDTLPIFQTSKKPLCLLSILLSVLLSQMGQNTVVMYPPSKPLKSTLEFHRTPLPDPQILYQRHFQGGDCVWCVISAKIPI